jgi:hypothetical protein
LARENIIAGMIEGDQPRLWRERLVQALRALRSGSVREACTVLWLEQRGVESPTTGPLSLDPQPAVRFRQAHKDASAAEV